MLTSQSLNDSRERVKKRMYTPGTDEYHCSSQPLNDLVLQNVLSAVPSKSKMLKEGYIAALTREGGISPCSLMLGMLYIKKLAHTNPAYLKTISSRNLFLVAMVIASKYMNDEGELEALTNGDWADIGCTSKTTVDLLEKDFLQAIDWKLYVSLEEYYAFVTSIEGRIALDQATKRGWMTYTDIAAVWEATDLQHCFLGASKLTAKVTLSSMALYFMCVTALFTAGSPQSSPSAPLIESADDVSPSPLAGSCGSPLKLIGSSGSPSQELFDCGAACVRFCDSSGVTVGWCEGGDGGGGWNAGTLQNGNRKLGNGSMENEDVGIGISGVDHGYWNAMQIGNGKLGHGNTENEDVGIGVDRGYRNAKRFCDSCCKRCKSLTGHQDCYKPANLTSRNASCLLAPLMEPTPGEDITQRGYEALDCQHCKNHNTGTSNGRIITRVAGHSPHHARLLPSPTQRQYGRSKIIGSGRSRARGKGASAPLELWSGSLMGGLGSLFTTHGKLHETVAYFSAAI